MDLEDHKRFKYSDGDQHKRELNDTKQHEKLQQDSSHEEEKQRQKPIRTFIAVVPPLQIIEQANKTNTSTSH